MKIIIKQNDIKVVHDIICEKPGYKTVYMMFLTL